MSKHWHRLVDIGIALLIAVTTFEILWRTR